MVEGYLEFYYRLISIKVHPWEGNTDMHKKQSITRRKEQKIYFENQVLTY